MKKSKMKKSKMKKSKMKKSKIKLSTFLFVDNTSPELKWLFKKPLKTRGMLSVLKNLGFVKNGQKRQKTHFYQVIHFVKPLQNAYTLQFFTKIKIEKNPKMKKSKMKKSKMKKSKMKKSNMKKSKMKKSKIKL